MPTTPAPPNRDHLLILPLFVIGLLLVGCATTLTTESFSVSPWQAAFSIALWLEDRCESQRKDDTTITLLEALHDGLVLPMKMLVAVGAVTIVSTPWSLYDRLVLPSGTPLPNRPDMVMAFVMPHRVGPVTQDPRDVHNIPVAWFGCLVYDDG